MPCMERFDRQSDAYKAEVLPDSCRKRVAMEAGVTAPDVLSIEGRSAGGLLMGAVINLRPGLFRACLAGVPFVDVMTTMCDPSIPLTIEEWEEWGNLDPTKME